MPRTYSHKHLTIIQFVESEKNMFFFTPLRFSNEQTTYCMKLCLKAWLSFSQFSVKIWIFLVIYFLTKSRFSAMSRKSSLLSPCSVCCSFNASMRNYKETNPLSMFIRFNALVTTKIESRYMPGIKNCFIIFILKKENNRYHRLLSESCVPELKEIISVLAPL